MEFWTAATIRISPLPAELSSAIYHCFVRKAGLGQHYLSIGGAGRERNSVQLQMTLCPTSAELEGNLGLCFSADLLTSGDDFKITYMPREHNFYFQTCRIQESQF